MINWDDAPIERYNLVEDRSYTPPSTPKFFDKQTPGTPRFVVEPTKQGKVTFTMRAFGHLDPDHRRRPVAILTRDEVEQLVDQLEDWLEEQDGVV